MKTNPFCWLFPKHPSTFYNHKKLLLSTNYKIPFPYQWLKKLICSSNSSPLILYNYKKSFSWIIYKYNTLFYLISKLLSLHNLRVLLFLVSSKSSLMRIRMHTSCFLVYLITTFFKLYFIIITCEKFRNKTL